MLIAVREEEKELWKSLFLEALSWFACDCHILVSVLPFTTHRLLHNHHQEMIRSGKLLLG